MTLTKKPPSENHSQPQIMLRTAPNFSNSTNRVPAHSLRHQISASLAGFLLKRTQNTQLTTFLQQLTHCGEALTSRLPSAVEFWSSRMNWAFLTALGNRLVRASPQQASCWSCFNRNLAKLADVWCLKLCAGTLFVLLVKFGVVLSIIYGYEWLFDGVFLVGGKDCRLLLWCSVFWGC